MLMQRDTDRDNVAVLELPGAPATPTVAAPPRRPSAGFLTGSGGVLLVVAIVLFATFYGDESAAPAVAEAKVPYQVTMASGTIIEVDPIQRTYHSVVVAPADQRKIAAAQVVKPENLSITTADNLVIEGARPNPPVDDITADTNNGGIPPAVFADPGSCRLPPQAKFLADGRVQFPGGIAQFIPDMRVWTHAAGISDWSAFPPSCGWLLPNGSFGGTVPQGWCSRPSALPVPCNQ